jgi:hypothetical protein
MRAAPAAAPFVDICTLACVMQNRCVLPLHSCPMLGLPAHPVVSAASSLVFITTTAWPLLLAPAPTPPSQLCTPPDWGALNPDEWPSKTCGHGLGVGGAGSQQQLAPALLVVYILVGCGSAEANAWPLARSSC